MLFTQCVDGLIAQRLAIATIMSWLSFHLLADIELITIFHGCGDLHAGRRPISPLLEGSAV